MFCKHPPLLPEEGGEMHFKLSAKCLRGADEFSPKGGDSFLRVKVDRCTSRDARGRRAIGKFRRKGGKNEKKRF
jgi:hypothetical protein